MKNPNVFGLVFSVGLLLLAAGSGLAGGPQPTGPSEALGSSASSAANAPWFTIEVDTIGDIGQHVSVAIDEDTGTPYISYRDPSMRDLCLARYVGSGGNCGPGSSWFCQTIDRDGDVGQYSSIVVSQGKVHISYYDASNGDLKYAYYRPPPNPRWYISTIDKGILPTSIGLYTSLKIDSNGRPHISYYYSNPTGVDALKIASSVGSDGNCGYGEGLGRWQCDTIQAGEGVGQYASLALDGAGNRHIAYYDRGNGDLWYATNRSGSNCGPGGNTWTCYPVAVASDVGQYASLYVDNANRFHIAYYDATADKLRYAVNVGGGGNCGVLGSAQCDEIDAMPAGYHPLGVSMAQDAAGYPIIAYQSYGGSLNVARPAAAPGLSGGGGNCGPEDLFSTWYCQTIDRAGTWNPYRNGDFVSVVVNSSGLATIAYYGFITSSGGNLNVAYQRMQVFLPVGIKNQ